MFNPELLMELLKKAQGGRSLNQFAQNCDIDAGNLSRIINNKNKMAPKPDTLRKIAENAYNGVTYEELMSAAGHISMSENAEPKAEATLSQKDQRDIEKRIEQLRQDLLNNPDGLMLSGSPISDEAVESLIEALSYGIKQAKLVNKKFTPKKHRK